MSTQSTINKIALPYAEALLELSKSSNLLKETTKDLSLISTTLSKSKDLQLFLYHPLNQIFIKKNVIKKIFENKVNDFILQFLFVLLDRRRIFLLITIIDKYLDLAYQLESTIVAELSTAIALTELQQNDLIKKIKIMTNSQYVKLIINIDVNLIGGFYLKIGSKVIDSSLAGKLKQISFYLNIN